MPKGEDARATASDDPASSPPATTAADEPGDDASLAGDSESEPAGPADPAAAGATPVEGATTKANEATVAAAIDELLVQGDVSPGSSIYELSRVVGLGIF